MKEKLHQELQRLAKHIIDANHSSELAPLYETAKTLYEKLAVLKFISQNLGDPHLDTDSNQMAEKFQQMAHEVLSSGEELPESNPHETDIMTPGMDTIIDMVSHMPKKERLPQESVPETEPPQDSPSDKQAQHAGVKNTATTLNGRYGQQISFGFNGSTHIPASLSSIIVFQSGKFDAITGIPPAIYSNILTASASR